jgi:hypothetical protein
MIKASFKWAVFFLLFYIESYPQIVIIPNNLGYHHSQMPYENSQRVTQYPFISGDTFRSICNFWVDCAGKYIDTKEIKPGDLIFIESSKEYLSFFFERVLPYIESPIMLVSHNNITTLPGDYSKYLDDKRIIAWFGKNADISQHPKMYHLPLGMADQYWVHGNSQILKKIQNHNTFTKSFLLYSNFKISTYQQERDPVYKIFHKKSFCFEKPPVSFKEYLIDLSMSKFTLSPRGSGVDCYRVWEAMYMQCIPIVKTSILDDLYADLPILIINDWNEITEEFLNAKYKEFEKKTFNYEKMYADYWIKKIYQVRDNWLKKN